MTSTQAYLIIALLVLLTLVFTGMIAAQYALEPRWEYTIQDIPDESFQQSMHKLGLQGWELVASRRAVSESSHHGEYECIFKRRAYGVRVVSQSR
jgi:hypothetical protein